jgi:hypothetical protein
MVIDDLLPEYDATKVEHVTVAAEPARVYATLLDADLMQAYRGSRSMRALFAVRGAPAAIGRRLRKQPPPSEPDALKLQDLTEEGEWVKLGEDFGKEFVFGAIGRFWGGEMEWRKIQASEFTAFDEPGYGKIAANLSVRSFGIGRSVLSYEARTKATDDHARRRFMLYWRAVSPGVGIVLRGTLAYIRSIAESD